MKYIFWEQYNCQKISGLPKLIIMGVKAVGLTHNVALISKKTSLVYKTLMEQKVYFEHIEEDSLNDTKAMNNDDVLILPALSPRTFILHKYNPKILLWQIYPSTCIKSIVNKLMLRIQMRKAIANNAFISMDSICYETFIKETGLTPNTIIPMPIDHMEYCYIPAHEGNDVLNVSYLGRAVSWKMYALSRMIKDMGEIESQKFFVHVFTDDEKELQRLIGSNFPPNVHVKSYIGFHGKQLLQQMRNMDFHMAMGISTLEGAALGLPTLIASLSHKDITEGYKYRWLFEDIEHYAGDYVENDMRKGGYSFSEIVSDLSSKQTKTELSQKCFEAVKPFTLESVGKAITSINTTLHLKDCHYRMMSYWKNKF